MTTSTWRKSRSRRSPLHRLATNNRVPHVAYDHTRGICYGSARRSASAPQSVSVDSVLTASVISHPQRCVLACSIHNLSLPKIVLMISFKNRGLAWKLLASRHTRQADRPKCCVSHQYPTVLCGHDSTSETTDTVVMLEYENSVTCRLLSVRQSEHARRRVMVPLRTTLVALPRDTTPACF